MGDKKDISVIFDVVGEIFDVDDFAEANFGGGVEGGELILEVVEALVEVVGG